MMRRFCFILIAILIKGIFCSAQVLENYATETIKILQSKGADSILHLSTDLLGRGSITYEDSLFCELPHYLFWKQEGKAFSQKLRPCYTPDGSQTKNIHSPVVNISAAAVFNFLASNLDSILESEVAPLIYKRVRNGSESYEIGWKTHPLIFKLAIYIGDTVFYKLVNPDHLEKEYGFPQLKNLNYSHNQSAAIWKFIDMIDRQIKDFEEKKIYTFK